MRVALVHDWLTGVRGGERVLDVIAGAFPDAEIYTLLHVPGSTTPELEARPIHTSPLDRIPAKAKHYRKALPLFPWAVRRLVLPRVDLVLSSSHAVAKSVRVPPGALHVCYCYTPMRYAWDQADAYLGRGARRWLAAPLVAALRAFDRRHSGPDTIHRFLAISTTVARRIFDAYGREARVLAPPVDLDRFRPSAAPGGDAYLLVSGFTPYKADALAIEAFARSGKPLLVVGDGPLRARIERRAPPNVRFLGRVPDAELAALYAGCRALIHPQVEDFGLIAVEAQACGRPVIALGHGGVLDSVRPLGGATPPTGVLFESQTATALTAAVERFEANESAFDPASIRAHAAAFGRERFLAALRAEIDDLMEKHGRDLRAAGGPS